MPTVVSYPGVYLEEVPSGSRAITGVATSICAFVGRTRRGPTDRTTTVYNFTEFERAYGPLWELGTVSYAVRQFFLNGGTEAVIARVARGGGASSTTAPLPDLVFVATAAGDALNGAVIALDVTTPGLQPDELEITITQEVPATDPTDPPVTLEHLPKQKVSVDPTKPHFVNTILALHDAPVRAVAPVPRSRPGADVALELQGGTAEEAAAARHVLEAHQATFVATSIGTWGDHLRVTIDHDTRDPADTDLFNVHVTEIDPDDPRIVLRRESFLNLSATPGNPRYAPDVLKEESQLVRMTVDVPGTRPAVASSLALGGGDDGSDLDTAAIQGALEEEGPLDLTDLFNLLVIPEPTPDAPALDKDTHGLAAALAARKNAVYLIDSPPDWDEAAEPLTGLTNVVDRHANAAIFFPRLLLADPLKQGRKRDFGAAASVAGLIARNDAQRGFWKAPAGLEANLRGVLDLTVPLTDMQQGKLNQVGINCIRTFPTVGTVSWGARTLLGADVLASEWKYLPVRRVALHIKESLYRGTQWAVFEPNDERLWAQLRLSIGTFMDQLFRKGAFAGSNPREAWFVKCDAETTTQADVDLGIVNIVVGFRPVLPAEFVIIKLQQMAGESAA